MSYTKIFCLICILLVSHNHTKAQSDSVTTEKIFFVVRHAEKDTGANPEISTMGMQRAGDLNRFLNAEKIDRILVTKYRRTAMTGDSVRISKSIDTSIYPADRIGAGLQNRLKELPDSENHFLIIGHSNTIPGIIRSFGLHDFLLDELPDHVYDRLYIIRVRNETVSLEEKRYGAHSVLSQ